MPPLHPHRPPSSLTRHAGNYFGALKQWASLQCDEQVCELDAVLHMADQHFAPQNKDVLSRLYCIVDLHAITVRSSVALPPLERRSLQCAAFLIACGLDSSRCTLFVQSHVPQHASLCWLLQCCTPLPWLHRMTQFKSKSEANSQGSAAASTALLTYPVLQAADILLYDCAPKCCIFMLMLDDVDMTRLWSLSAKINCST